MCGIFCTLGRDALARTGAGLEKLRHRGPDQESIWSAQEDVAIGFARLAINGRRKPKATFHQYKNLVGVFNAEIYNHLALAEKLGWTGDDPIDTEVILPLFEKYQMQMIDQIDGFYAGIIYNMQTKELFWCKDSVGKKPLFLAADKNHLYLTSEAKALPNIIDLQPLPLGIGKIGLENGATHLKHRCTSKNLPGDQLEWMSLFESAVLKRLKNNDTNKAGIFLSGGIDSAIISALAEKNKGDMHIHYYALADQESPDYSYICDVLEYLKIPPARYRFIPPPSRTDTETLIKKVIYATESYNPSIISNGMGTFLLSQAAREDGVKVVLSGDGADEVFCGYWDLKKTDNWKETRAKALEYLHMTELRRVDLASMAHSVEVRCPFLDLAIISKAQTLQYKDLFLSDGNKIMRKKILRDLFSHMLPDQVISRGKLPFDRGSGLQENICKFCNDKRFSEESFFKNIWHQKFQDNLGKLCGLEWFWSYPLFDEAIKKRGDKYV